MTSYPKAKRCGQHIVSGGTCKLPWGHSGKHSKVKR